jgi:hypothetical protein
MPISKSDKTAYNEYVKDLKADKEASYKHITELQKKQKELPRIKSYYVIESVLELLKIISLELNMSDASLEIMNFKNENSLKNARKEFINVLQKMEDLVGNQIDRSLKENEDYLQALDRISPKQWLDFIKRLHYVLSTLIEKIGETSKWKWSFVDLNARVAVITKNIINFSDIQKYRDPRTEFFRERQELMRVCRASLRDVAQQYRNKYEQSTKVPGDMLRSLEFLAVLRKILILFSETDEANKVKNTIDALRARLEADEKDKDKKDKKSEKSD